MFRRLFFVVVTLNTFADSWCLCCSRWSVHAGDENKKCCSRWEIRCCMEMFFFGQTSAPMYHDISRRYDTRTFAFLFSKASSLLFSGLGVKFRSIVWEWVLCRNSHFFHFWDCRVIVSCLRGFLNTATMLNILDVSHQKFDHEWFTTLCFAWITWLANKRVVTVSESEIDYFDRASHCLHGFPLDNVYCIIKNKRLPFTFPKPSVKIILRDRKREQYLH